MNDLWIFILALVCGILPLTMFIYWWKYRNTIIFKTAFANLVTILFVSIISFIVGKYGLNNLIWFVPAGYSALFLGNYIFISIVQKPLKSTTGIIEKISKGEMDVIISQRLQQRKDEIGIVNHSIADLLNYLKDTADFAEKIGKDQEATLELLSNKDYLRKSMKNMQEALSEAKKLKEKQSREEEKRLWANEGQAKLNDILRQQEEMKETSYKIISFLVKYLNANQGGIFIRQNNSENESPDEQNAIYELQAAYAYNRRKFTEKTIQPGEGLIGTCIQEKEVVYLTDIPDQYLEITSGLGQSNPKSLILIPLKQEEDIPGVIEIASFTEFEHYQIDFLKQAALSIASSIHQIENSQRTTALLTKTQQQAEEMASQEEEMRQNMEEMQATQEEMQHRSEKMMEIAKEVYQEEGKLREFINKMKSE
jgi:transcriptional regulator with GAF, ATPase, and Fis domain